MGMYTELNIGVQIIGDSNVIQKLNYMLDETVQDVVIDHPLFKTNRWRHMLLSDSYYFDGQTDSKLIYDPIGNGAYYLNVRCNLKDYDGEIKHFLNWLCPYIATEGFLGYTRYEEDYVPTLIYKEDGRIEYKHVAWLKTR